MGANFDYKELIGFLEMYAHAKFDYTHICPYIVGESGIGKSEIMEQVFVKAGYTMIQCQIGTKTLEYFMGLPEITKWQEVVRDKNGVAVMQPRLGLDGKPEKTKQIDEKGNPVIDEKGNSIMIPVLEPKMKTIAETTWTPPELVVLANREEKAVIFIDDFHLAREEERKVMFELLTTHSIHGFRLNDSVKVVMAANPQDAEYGATVTDLPKPIRSRIAVFRLNHNVEQWCHESLDRGIDKRIVAFLRFNEAQLLTEADDAGQYACPRSYWGLSDYLKAGFPLSMKLTTGFIGAGAASDLMGFHDVYQKFEDPANRPKKWTNLGSDHAKKAAFTAYLMIKDDLALIKKFVVDMTHDKDSSAFAILLLKSISSKRDIDDPRCLEVFDMVDNQDIIECLGYV